MADDSDTSSTYGDTAFNSDDTDGEPDEPWQERLMYAHDYIKRILVSGCEDDLKMVESCSIPDISDSSTNTTLSGDDVYVEILSSYKTQEAMFVFDEPDPRVPVFYWEATYQSRASSYPTFWVYAGHDGGMFWRLGIMGRSDDVPASDGDIIGCGNIPQYGLFYTKNGVLLDSKQFPALNVGRRRTRVTVSSETDLRVKFHFNFGQEPFAFDVATFFTRQFERLRQLMASVPVEVLELVLGHVLDSIAQDLEAIEDDSNQTIPARRAERDWNRLAAVCRRWREVCLRRNHGALILYSRASVASALTRRSYMGKCNLLSTYENSPSPWLHCFLASALPRLLISASQWTCQFGNSDHPFLAKFPGIVYPFLRQGCFRHLRRLELKDVIFQTWLQFVRFVMALPQMNRLVLERTYWHTTNAILPDDPPRWIRFYRRIRSIKFDDTCTPEKYRILLPLLVGTQTVSPPISASELVLAPQDVICTLGLVKLFCEMCEFRSIRCESLSKTRFAINCFDFDPGASSHRSEQSNPVLTLRFTRHQSIYRLSYASLWITKYEYEDFAAQLGSLLTRFPTFQHCHFRFNLRYSSDTLWLELMLSPEWVASAAKQSLLRRRIYEETWQFAIDGRVEVATESAMLSQRNTTDTNHNITILNKKKRYWAGDTAKIVWSLQRREDVNSTVSWMRLFKSTTLYPFVDIGHHVQRYPRLGMGSAEFTMPDAPPGTYFLAIGNIEDRTEEFEII